MSRIKLVELGRDFLSNRISAEQFCEDIVIERDRLWGVREPDKAVDRCGGELFILADCYNPDSDRDDYELDEAELRAEVKALLEQFNLL
ncbi:colicin immunity domain-containing protein [Erwinia sp. HDF1-3R]|uniref:colicin immunity domain-containing protein n=1 Tax=Erwinia sp. HDF1-3R TaxID=3141543 RepID=UPI0031F4C891